MARPYRLQEENCFYHITSRGDDRKKLYISEFDYKKFLEYLLNAKERFKFYLYAYVLMPNHYHILIATIHPNLSKLMHYINTSYATYYNIKRKRFGHLFQGRYKSIVVDKENYFLELTRYIHLNPVKARMVEDPTEYKWSSYNGYINKTADKYIDKEKIGESLNMNQTQYRQFVLDGTQEGQNPFKDVYAGFILGSTTFIKDKLKDLKERIGGREISYKKAITGYIEKEAIIDIISKKYRKSAEELCRLKKRPGKERKIAIYLIKRLSNITNAQIGEIFGITYSAVSKATADIERLIKENREVRKEVEGLISHFKV